LPNCSALDGNSRDNVSNRESLLEPVEPLRAVVLVARTKPLEPVAVVAEYSFLALEVVGKGDIQRAFDVKERGGVKRLWKLVVNGNAAGASKGDHQGSEA
jgi:hypothetical protein